MNCRLCMAYQRERGYLIFDGAQVASTIRVPPFSGGSGGGSSSSEEIGYLLMSISFICVVPIFSRTNKLQNSIRWVYIIGFILTIISFILILIFYGINREYRFEVAVIMIDYLTLTISGILLSIMFKNTMRIAVWVTFNRKFITPPFRKRASARTFGHSLFIVWSYRT